VIICDIATVVHRLTLFVKASCVQDGWWSHWTERNWTTIWNVLYVFFYFL